MSCVLSIITKQGQKRVQYEAKDNLHVLDSYELRCSIEAHDIVQLCLGSPL